MLTPSAPQTPEEEERGRWQSERELAARDYQRERAYAVSLQVRCCHQCDMS